MAQAMIDQQIYSQYPKSNRVEEDNNMQTLLDTFSEEIGSQQDDNDIQKSKSKSSYKVALKFVNKCVI